MGFSSFLGLLYLASTSMVQAAPLPLDAYMNEVKAQNQGYQAADKLSVVAADRSLESELALEPYLFGDVTESFNEQARPSPLMGEKQRAHAFTIGVAKQSTFGLTARLTHSQLAAKVDGANPAFVTSETTYETKTSLELSQPLLKNRWGKTLKTQIEQQRLLGEAQKAAEAFKASLVLIEAESAYWRLALARESVLATKDAVDRAKRIRDWNAKRTNQMLSDRADLLQSEAVMKARELEARAARDEESSAARAFNTLRGQPEVLVNADLQRITPDIVAKISVPTHSGERGDIVAARSNEQAAALATELGSEKYDASLDAFGTLAFNGKSEKYGAAFSDSLKPAYPSMVIGLRLNKPLGGEKISRQRGALAKEKEAQSLLVSRRAFEVSREWQDLEQRLQDAQERLHLASEMETAQKERLDHERNRNRNGRSTTFQVLSAEGDFAQAQLSRIRAVADVLRLVTQMKSFGGAA